MRRCQSIQLLECYPAPVLTTGGDVPLSIEEGGALALSVGVPQYTVVFAQAKLNALYDFIESDVTSTDPNPLLITPSMLERTDTGFTLQLDGLPDTANFIFNWRVRVVNL